MTQRRILITGCNGFTGKHLVARLRLEPDQASDWPQEALTHTRQAIEQLGGLAE